jgi:hypothetical protein
MRTMRTMRTSTKRDLQFLQKWAENLRSGWYVPLKGFFCEKTPSSNRYGCLGVLEEVLTGKAAEPYHRVMFHRTHGLVVPELSKFTDRTLAWLIDNQNVLISLNDTRCVIQGNYDAVLVLLDAYIANLERLSGYTKGNRR